MFDSGGSIPKPERQAPPPKEEDKAIQEANAEAARRRKTTRGYRSTILASQMMADDAPALKETFGT